MSDWSLSDPLPSNEKEVANEGNENQVDDHLYIHQDSDIEGYTPPGTPPKRDMEGKSQPTDSQMEWRMDNLENALERHSDILDNHAEIIRDQTVAILDMKENIDNLNTVIQKLTEQIGKLTSEVIIHPASSTLRDISETEFSNNINSTNLSDGTSALGDLSRACNELRRSIALSEMSLDDIKTLILQLESDRRKSDGQPSDDRQKIAAKQAIITDKCYRCNKAVAPHKGDNCPNKDNLKDGYRKPRRN
ncbi:uncharacterized protein LOC116417801 isoform X2 [Nasonia vitripennis]|uniref:Uncharacterized protein n=1 Tax=Nasonia vitripennis TaxID=7425 RepID=A0A7M7QP82_NASVI|nr:uncharacterized protein LOC116417801 isoform X2 [Nasonia vitripennis]